MLKYFYYNLKTFIQWYPGRVLKMIGICLFVVILMWHYVLKRPIYQRLYGVPSEQKLEIWTSDIFTDIQEQPVSQINVNGYDIEIQAIKKFETTARVIYIDRYGKLGTWYRSREGAYLYDAVVPQDISLATGSSGHHFNCFRYDHEYRGLLLELNDKNSCSTQIYKNLNHEITNNHSIAATPTVQRGIDILKVGDIAHIEGYAVYWNGTGKLQYQRFESAITPGQISKQLLGGQRTLLCRQLLITKLTFDGYTFE